MPFDPCDHTFAICAYKENPFLEQTILSLKEQSSLGSLLISTSTPNDHILSLAEKHDIPLTVNPDPQGAGGDWNWAYDHARTPLVTLAHQDDIYTPLFLEKTLQAFNDRTSEVSLAFSDYYEIRGDDLVWDNRILRVKRILNAPFRHKHLGSSIFIKRRVMALGCSICCPSVTYNKEYLGEGIFDTRYINSCDYQTWVKLASQKGRFAYIPEQIMGHRIYAESATTKNLGDHIRQKEDEEILATLWPRPIAHMINSLYATSEKSNDLEG